MLLDRMARLVIVLALPRQHGLRGRGGGDPVALRAWIKQRGFEITR